MSSERPEEQHSLRKHLLTKSRRSMRKAIGAGVLAVSLGTASAEALHSSSHRRSGSQEHHHKAAPQVVITAEEVRLAEQALDAALHSKLIRELWPEAQKFRTWFLALMLKESRLDPRAESRSQAKGYFQVRDVARRQVNMSFDLSLTPRDIEENPSRNIAGGILYLRVCLNRAERLFPAEMDPEQQMKLALMIYNVGEGSIRELLQRGDTYEKLMTRISQALAKQTHSPMTESGEIEDASYGIRYRQFPGVDRYLEAERRGTSLQKKVSDVGAHKVGQALRYPELIFALSQHMPETLAKLQIRRVSGRVASSRAHPIEPRFRHTMRTETLSQDRYLWAMANELLRDAKKANLPGFDHLEKYETRIARREEILEALIRYNVALSPAFARLEINDDYSNIPKGTVIGIPEINVLWTYMVNAREQSYQDIRQIESKTREQPIGQIYADASMDAKGEALVTKGPKPAMKVLPTSIAGLSPRAETRYIVLHSTASGLASHSSAVEADLEDRRIAHYFIAKNGTITQILEDNISIDHAGKLSNSRRRSLWNGESVSERSIGIEVEAAAGHEWNDRQYEAVGQLCRYLGGKYHLQNKDVVTHGQIASSPLNQALDRQGGSFDQVRGRKWDPYILNWLKFWPTNNDLLLDPDVIRGVVKPNLEAIRQTRRLQRSWSETHDDTLAGLEVSYALYLQRATRGEVRQAFITPKKTREPKPESRIAQVQLKRNRGVRAPTPHTRRQGSGR